MHDTDLPLGRYVADPRFKIVNVDGRDAIRTDRATIIAAGDSFQVWMLDDPNALYPAHTSKRLAIALRYVLGDPAKVGPTGMREWLHTDGRTYRHDPATTGMVEASSLRVGDVVDYPHLDAFELVADPVNTANDLGEWQMTWFVKRLPSRHNGTFSPRSGDMIPIRFAR